MRLLAHLALLAGLALPAAAQPNPFKLPKSGVKGGIVVSYALTGDLSGTAFVASDGERLVHRQTGTLKLMGKASSNDNWVLTTPDSTYRVDLSKKQGTVAPNLLPSLATAYDELDGAAKKRLHQNMEDMGAMLSRAFYLAGLNGGEKLSSKSYAGQECEERQFGPMRICTMNKAPILLHSQLSLVCMNFEETATEVKLGAPPADAFTPPAGVSWTADSHLQKPDSMARGFVLYLSSQQLADSIAKAKQEVQAAEGQAHVAAGQQPPKPTPEQQAQMQQACEMLKNFDVGKVMAQATNQMAKEMADAAKRAAVDAAKNAGTNKLKGLFKKPKIP